MEIRTENMLSPEARRTILERIVEHYGIESQAEFARRLGTSPQNLNSWLARGTYNVELLAVSFPELSGDWLLTGEEPMLKKDRVPAVPQEVTDLARALNAVAEEQKLTAKAQAQADKLLDVLNALAGRLRTAPE